jgi:hypothetical protein
LETDVSASFFAKKEAKKLLYAGGCGTQRANAHGHQKFFASFFQKRSAFFHGRYNERYWQDDRFC